MKTFTDRLIDKMREKQSILCVGLDPQINFMPPQLIEWAKKNFKRSTMWEMIGRLYFEFNKKIIDETAPFAVAVKPQMAFYERYGMWGVWAHEQTIAYGYGRGLVIVTDAKRGDGSDTADAYADEFIGRVPIFDLKRTADKIVSVSFTEWPRARGPMRVDAVTVNGYIGSDCLRPFVRAIKEYGTGAFVVDKTSFSPNSEVEELSCDSSRKVWEELALMVEEWGRGTEGQYGFRNLGVVLGATKPEDASVMRDYLPKSWFLVPGYGKQGGGADGAVAGSDEDGNGVLVNSARGIIAKWTEESDASKRDPERFAQSAGEAAKASRDDLNRALQKAKKWPY